MDRASERNIPWELVKDTIRTGSFHRFGKHMVKIEKRFRERTICCVGQIHKDCIKIITITQSGEKAP